MQEEVITLAYNLKDLLKNDGRIILLNQYEKEMEENEEVMRLCYLKDTANSHYNDMLKIYDKDSLEVSNALKELYLRKKEFEEHPLVRRYLKQYQEVKNLYNEINNILFKDINAYLCPKEK